MSTVIDGNSGGTAVTTTSSDTLSNKTISSPTITGVITGVGSQSITTFMSAQKSISTNTALCNTGSIGANGQTWLIIGTLQGVATGGQAFILAWLYDGTNIIAAADCVTPAANQTSVITIHKVVTLTAATTFTLYGYGNQNSPYAQSDTTVGGITGKVTNITAIRLA